MKSKSLAARNRYLKSASGALLVARNLASSTAVETGRPSGDYVTRYCSARFISPAGASGSKPLKK